MFPKHARLDGPKSFTNWLCQLRLTLPNQLRSYVLDGVISATWTAEQLPARDNAAREIIVGSIDSADVSAALDAIPSDQLSAPCIFATLKARFAPDDATRTLELFARLWDFKKMPASVEAYNTWLREYMSVAQEIRDAKTLLNDVLATHVLAMVLSCLDSFRLTFTDEQRSQRELPKLTMLTDRIRIQLRLAGLSIRQSPRLSGEVESQTEVMRRELRNKKGARAGIGPAAGEIAGPLRQSRASKQLRASKSSPQGGGLAGSRNDRGAPVELRVV
ncbi:BQ5605_C006g03970 [Microbotryum silenes-dioicae]|uniref:BQ5605_C006g03970 protein n=1 Tax=Microbotryum silenes-dioicae TaxID=796604 RepID=A0A2X0MZU3_9BASI|nr:BQ5605_C006g03970 [Microbotryum silenes-dioicae]